MHHALIVAHGQPSDPDPAEAALAAFAAEVDALCGSVSVGSATLAASGALETQLDKRPGTTVIYPLFMSRGWFVTTALRKRVTDRPVCILDPLGVDPHLPELVAGVLRGNLTRKHWAPRSTDLVIAAHGSGRSRDPSTVATAFADRLARQISFRTVRLGFVEEPPSISEVARGAGVNALCLPFFACTGEHVLKDVPDALQRAEFKGEILPVVGELPDIKHHIAETLAMACSDR